MAILLNHAKFPRGLIARGLEGFRSHPGADLQPSGISELDALLGGGFPRGSLIELCGPSSSGRTSLAFSLLAQATERQETCAFVDVSDSLDPISLAAAGVELPRLLWIRCGETDTAGADPKASAYFAQADEEGTKTRDRGSKSKKPAIHGWGHPRESMRGVEKAIPSLVGKTIIKESAQIHVVPRCAGEQVERDRQLPRRGIRPPRSLPSVPESNATNDAPHTVKRTRPWKRLEQGLKSTDLLLHSGGWGVVVFDLGGISWMDARRINLSMWFRFRRAVENTPTILLLLGEESCAKSCASVVLRCQRKADNWNRAAECIQAGAATFEGFEVQGEVTRSRVARQTADFARWQTHTP